MEAAKPLACMTDSAGTQSSSTLELPGVGGAALRLGTGRYRRLRYLPGTRSPGRWRGGVRTEAEPCPLLAQRSPLCPAVCLAARGTELQGRCQRSQPSPAATAALYPLLANQNQGPILQQIPQATRERVRVKSGHCQLLS